MPFYTNIFRGDDVAIGGFPDSRAAPVHFPDFSPPSQVCGLIRQT